MKFIDVIQELNKQIDLIINEVDNQLGELKEPVSLKRQMQAFKEMQPEDWAAMITQRGLPETTKYIQEMRRREAISNAKSTIW